MKRFPVVLLLVVCVAGGPLGLEEEHEWASYKSLHKKVYSNETEDLVRREIYFRNKKMVEEHNKKYERGEVLYFMKLNRFSDKKPEEFKVTNGYRKRTANQKALNQNSMFKPHEYPDPPASFDWRDRGAVVPVKNQGSCGSCWAFSTVGALESQYFLKTGNLVSLSEQNLVDCSWDYGNEGCDGGYMEAANQYISDNGGIDTEESYPYEGVNGKCRYSDENAGGATSQGFIDLPYKDEDALVKAIAFIGPITVSMDAGYTSFDQYAGGIYYEPECDPDDLDHGVLAVGYGVTENGTYYYIVKNSWGTDWGEQGYFRIIRNKNNHCGISSESTYPIV